MLKLNWVKEGIVGFFKKNKSAAWAILIALVGLALVVAGTVGVGRSKSTPSADDIGEEERLTELCSEIEGVGECHVMITLSSDSKRVESAAIVCQGADSVTVRHGLVELITSLYGIGSNRVSISKMKKA